MNIQEFLANVQGHAFWIGIAFGLVFISMFIDLITKLIKTHRLGEETTSSGLRKTASKAQKYFLPLLSCACIDLLLCALPIYTLPFFAILFAVYCMLCEAKSVVENTRTKDELKETARTMVNIMKAKDNTTDLVAEILKTIVEDKDIEVNKDNITTLIENDNE